MILNTFVKNTTFMCEENTPQSGSGGFIIHSDQEIYLKYSSPLSIPMKIVCRGTIINIYVKCLHNYSCLKSLRKVLIHNIYNSPTYLGTFSRLTLLQVARWLNCLPFRYNFYFTTISHIRMVDGVAGDSSCQTESQATQNKVN